MTAKLIQNKVTIVAALSVLFVAVLGYLVLVSPQRSQANELRDKIASTEAELAQARIDASRVQPQKPPVSVADLFRLTKAMPDETDMPGLLLELAQVAQETGISFDSITPGEPVAESSYQKLPVSLVFQGNFYELSDFLFRLRNLVQVRENRLRVDGRLFTIEGIDFAQGEDEFPQIQATLTASAFVYGGTPPAVEPPAPPPADAGSAAGATP